MRSHLRIYQLVLYGCDDGNTQFKYPYDSGKQNILTKVCPSEQRLKWQIYCIIFDCKKELNDAYFHETYEASYVIIESINLRNLERMIVINEID